MLDDRSYMRGRSREPLLVWSSTVILMVVVVACFFAQHAAKIYWHAGDWTLSHLALSTEGLKNGFIWQLLTFQFLHANPAHLVGNLLGLFFFGRPVESRLGARQFLRIYFLSGLAGGLLQSLAQWLMPGHFGLWTVGASAGVCGVVAAFALMDPEAQVFLGFVLPLRAKHLLWIEIVISVAFTIFPGTSNVAHTAHLGGILGAMAYMRWGLHRSSFNWNPLQGRRRKRQLVQAAAQISRWRGRRDGAEAVELPPEEFISKEVDPILDKISAHGIHSLTPRERQVLEAARSKMAKR